MLFVSLSGFGDCLLIGTIVFLPSACFVLAGRLKGLVGLRRISWGCFCVLFKLIVRGSLHKFERAKNSFLINVISILSIKLMFKMVGFSKVAVKGRSGSSSCFSFGCHVFVNSFFNGFLFFIVRHTTGGEHRDALWLTDGYKQAGVTPQLLPPTVYVSGVDT